MPCPYLHYYSHQAGTGIGAIYKGAPYQRGHGIGSFLGGLFRSVLPLLKNGAKVVGKEALNAGVGLLSDMLNVQPIDESIRSRFKTATSNLKQKADKKIDSIMNGSGYKIRRQKRKRVTSKNTLKQKGSKKIKHSNIQDIFFKS